MVKIHGPLRGILVAVAMIYTIMIILAIPNYADAKGVSEKSTYKPCTESSTDTNDVNLKAASELIERWLPCEQASQFTLQILSPSEDGKETFEISEGTGDDIIIAGTNTSALLTGFNWYLKYVANANISLNGDQLNLPDKLPMPERVIRQGTDIAHRFALNDTNEGYTGPYQSWEEWERQIDTFALNGINELQVYVGQEAVYYETFQKFNYSGEEMRDWIPLPAHQPWWLLQNMSAFPSPISKDLIDKRVALGQKIADRLRELGMTPVFPGYYGTVPADFEERNPGALVVPQGSWVGFEQPDWLDPTNEHFSQVAEEFYRVQDELFGETTMYKMDLLHEGGIAGEVDVGDASKAVQQALEVAHPDAIWAILGWQSNPHQETLKAIDRSKMLILDGLADRYDGLNREQDWLGTPYAFGTIWNFGGHTTMGANMSVWNERFYEWKSKGNSALTGIALIPEAIDNNPIAIDFFTELAWRNEPVDMDEWYAEYAERRYGNADTHSASAWKTIGKSAYSMPSDGWSEAQDGLFSAQPSLTTNTSAVWSPTSMRYDPAVFAKALPELLKVDASLRNSSAYRYDLMDVTRQVLSNESRNLLPVIKTAYDAKDAQEFKRLSAKWLDSMELLDRVVGTNIQTMLGPWLEDAKGFATTEDEQAALEYDARSLVSVWGNESGANSGLRDYANREWQGLVGDYYYSRWKTYFDTLDVALETEKKPKLINWYAFGHEWAEQPSAYPTKPTGDIYAIAEEVYDLLVSEASATVESDLSSIDMLEPGETNYITGVFTNTNVYGAARDVEITLSGDGMIAVPITPTKFTSLAPNESVTVEWELTIEEGIKVTHVTPKISATYEIGTTKGTATSSAHIYVKNAPEGIAYLSDLGLLAGSFNGYGPMERDMHNGETAAGDGGPIMIGGVHYEKGLGTNSNADLRFYLGGSCTRFSAIVGIDDTMTAPDKDPDVVVRVYADDEKIYESPLIDGTEAYELDLPVDGAQQLRLEVGQYDENNWFDRANWADAKVTCSTSSTASSNAAEMKTLVEGFEEDGEFENDQIARSLKNHLTAVSRYEEKELAEKVIKHMEGFKLLLDYQRENEWISEKAYNTLKADADSLLKKWK